MAVRAPQKGQRWRWQVEGAATGQVLAAVFGRRTHATLCQLRAVLRTAGWQVFRLNLLIQ